MTKETKERWFVGWVDHKTEFKKGMLLESPIGSIVEVLEAKHSIISTSETKGGDTQIESVEEDESGTLSLSPQSREKTKRKTPKAAENAVSSESTRGKTKAWTLNLQDLRSGETFERNMTKDPKAKGRGAWGLSGYVIISKEYADQVVGAWGGSIGD